MHNADGMDQAWMPWVLMLQCIDDQLESEVRKRGASDDSLLLSTNATLATHALQGFAIILACIRR